MPGTTTTSSSGAGASTSAGASYHRPGYLRALEAYETVKKAYGYGRDFVGVRTVAPLAERIVEGTLARLPVIKSLKEPATEEEKAQAGYPTLRGIDARVAALLAHLDEMVDTNLGNPKTLQGRVLRVATHTIYAVANYTPVVGGPIRKLMVDIDPEHMKLRLTDRPSGLDVSGEDADLMRASFDKDMDDVSVVTDASDEVAAAQANGKGKKKKKEKRKDKRFLQNMGKGIKKVINYPRTPVHDITPNGANGTASAAASVATGDAPSIGGEEEASLASGTTPVAPASASSSASIASTDAVASTGGSSSTASTPLRATARKFFAAAAPGSGGKKAKAAAAAAAAAAPAGANPSSA